MATLLPVSHHLVGAAEVARMLGVSRQRVNELIRTNADFPEPEAELSAGRIWSRSMVEGWMRVHRLAKEAVTVTEIAGVTVAAVHAFEEVSGPAERFLKRRPVMVDLRDTDQLLARRVVDFCTGLVYGQRGQVETFFDRVLLMTPKAKEVDESTRRHLTGYLTGDQPGVPADRYMLQKAAEYCREAHGLIIGPLTAEQIVRELLPASGVSMEVVGADVETGSPKKVTVTRGDLSSWELRS